MKSVSFFVLAAALPLCAQVKITQRTDRISVDIDGKPFTEMFIGADTNKPYLHPLRTASGLIMLNVRCDTPILLKKIGTP